IVVGAYERILYGLSFCEKGKENELQIKNSKQSTLTTSLPYSISPFFIFPAHIGCIKSVNVGVSRYLASGSTDEFIKLYDMKSRKELGSLQEHKGSITCLEFVGKNHLVSGSEDGTIMIWRTKDWEVLKTLKGHTGKIHSLSVHPTGKLALSVGSDKLMFLWNMMTGHKASSIRLPKVADAIQWNKKGDLYAVMYESFIEIYSTASSKPINRIESSSIRCKFMSL
ncbi:WD40 repeat-like protein, partial [Neoconidiobolus thromboides FSU 785]